MRQLPLLALTCTKVSSISRTAAGYQPCSPPLFHYSVFPVRLASKVPTVVSLVRFRLR